MTSYSIAEANSKLAQIVREAEAGKPVEITRRGQPVAVVLSAETYLRLSLNKATWTTLAQLREQHQMHEYGFSDDEFADFVNSRDKSPGREIVFKD